MHKARRGNALQLTFSLLYLLVAHGHTAALTQRQAFRISNEAVKPDATSIEQQHGASRQQHGRSLKQFSTFGQLLSGAVLEAANRGVNTISSTTLLGNFYGAEGFGFRNYAGALPAPGGITLMALKALGAATGIGGLAAAGAATAVGGSLGAASRGGGNIMGAESLLPGIETLGVLKGGGRKVAKTLLRGASALLGDDRSSSSSSSSMTSTSRSSSSSTGTPTTATYQIQLPDHDSLLLKSQGTEMGPAAQLGSIIDTISKTERQVAGGAAKHVGGLLSKAGQVVQSVGQKLQGRSPVTTTTVSYTPISSSDMVPSSGVTNIYPGSGGSSGSSGFVTSYPSSGGATPIGNSGSVGVNTGVGSFGGPGLEGTGSASAGAAGSIGVVPGPGAGNLGNTATGDVPNALDNYPQGSAANPGNPIGVVPGAGMTGVGPPGAAGVARLESGSYITPEQQAAALQRQQWLQQWQQPAAGGQQQEQLTPQQREQQLMLLQQQVQEQQEQQLVEELRQSQRLQGTQQQQQHPLPAQQQQQQLLAQQQQQQLLAQQQQQLMAQQQQQQLLAQQQQQQRQAWQSAGQQAHLESGSYGSDFSLAGSGPFDSSQAAAAASYLGQAGGWNMRKANP